jgi:glutathione peroxidase
MKLFLLAMFFYAGDLLAQSQVYDITIPKIDGTSVSLSSYKGKKIVVLSVSPGNIQNGTLAVLDSLQAANPSFVVIAVPATDFAGNDDSLKIDAIKKNSPRHVIVAAADAVKKSNGAKQNRLLQWLTNSSQNTHFDADVTTDVQLYLISESGILFAVLEKGTPTSLIVQLLKQADVKL